MLDRLTIERMLAWSGEKPVLVALSGGGDSVALLHLLVEELGAGRVCAAIVDHALREGSAADAARARAFAEALGVKATVLTLSWPDGANRGQEAARGGRYRALCEHARTLGLNTIAAAHTADDQAETVLMRAARGSNWRGLAGIAPFAYAPLWPEGRGIALARPLLSCRRQDLRNYLRHRGVGWIEDPANTNLAFERIRVRERLHALAEAGFDVMRLAKLAARLRLRADQLDEAALALLSRAASPANFIFRAAWSGPDEVRQRALSALMAGASGVSREPPWSEMAALERRIMHPEYRGGTHGGVEFRPTKDGVVLLRDAGAVLGRADGPAPLSPLALKENVETIWDGRLAITAREAGWRVVPAQNGDLAAFEHDGVPRTAAQAFAHLTLQSLSEQRVAHAFAPDINRAKP